MAAGGEMISVMFGSLQDGAAGLQTTYNAIQTSLDDLQSQVENNLAAWDGDARATYFVAKARWENDAKELALILNRMGVHVAEAHDGYTVAENRNAGFF
jgi:WXG100 family type VII secretion target